MSKLDYSKLTPSTAPKWVHCAGEARAEAEMRREQLRAMGFNIPDEGTLAARAKLEDINGSD